MPTYTTSAYASKAGYASVAGFAADAFNATYAGYAGYVGYALKGKWADAASYANKGGYSTTAGVAGYAINANWAIKANSASYVGYAGRAAISDYVGYAGVARTVMRPLDSKIGYASVAGYATSGNYSNYSNLCEYSLYTIAAGYASNAGYATRAGTAVAIQSPSDYRLKTNLEPITDSEERVKRINAYRFNWTASPTGQKVDGFLAHEISQIVPEAVIGEKDAIDENGNPVYQTLDYSKVVPLLIASTKESCDKLQILEKRLFALENNKKAL